MAYGQYGINVNIASGASTSSNIDLLYYRNTVFVYVGTMSTAAAITVQGSPDGGTTFYNKFIFANSATTQANQVVIASGVGTNGGQIQLEGGGRFMRLITSAVVSGGVTFKILANE